MRRLLKRLGLGRIIYYAWHWPRGEIAISIRAGGPIEQWRTARGRAAMRRAAAGLARQDFAGPALELHLLTGRRFWYQTAFCLWSFSRQAGRALAPVIYDDGSLGAAHRAELERLFPAARFVAQADTIARLDAHLPAARFPVLRERWIRYPHIRKLTDPHAGSSGWKLVVDSDLLFFHKPQFLIDWLGAPARPLHAVDVEKSYGYSDALLASLAQSPLHPRLNVGLCGLNSSELDWELLEDCCRRLIAAEGTSYYLEQALVALILAGRGCAEAPALEYLTLPRPPEAVDCKAVMHHYVADSKRWYFRRNWRVAAGIA